MAKGSTLGKDPAVSWVFNDWQGGTMTLSRFQKGCYMDLLTAQFNTGHLSLDEIKTVLGSDFGSSWPTLQKKFIKDSNDLFYNERLEFEIVKRKKYNKSRRENLEEKSDERSPHKGIGNGDEIGIGSFGKFENLLSEVEIGATIEYVSITGKKTLTEQEVENYFKAFIIHSEGKSYNGRSEKIQHFRTWLKIQIKTDGSHQQTPKPGTSQARIEALRKW